MDANAVKDFILSFSSIFYEALPFIVIGALIAGLLEEFVPQQLLTRILPQQALPAIMLGGALGLVFPMCECGIVVVMRRLLRKGLPLSTCVAYMLAGPIVNPIVMASTIVAFAPHAGGWGIISLRIGFGFLVAVTTALIVHRAQSRHGIRGLILPHLLPSPPALPQKSPLSLEMVSKEPANEEPESPPKRQPLGKRIGNVSETALHDFVDITVFLILGALLASLVKGMYTPDQVASLSQAYPALAVLLMMALAVVLCLCSEADAFVAASFQTMTAAPKVAFLVLGPMMDIKLFLMYTRIFRSRLIVTIITAVVLQVFVLSMLTHVLWDPIMRLWGSIMSLFTNAAISSPL